MSDPRVKLQTTPAHPEGLLKILEQSTNVEGLVQECAGELSAVNSSVKRELVDLELRPRVKGALAKNKSVEEKVHQVSDKLSAVNDAIRGQVRDRVLLERQFAAVVEQEQIARHESLHDVLTGLPNRALFEDRLEHGLAQAQRHGWGMAVMFIDLDDFKTINDSHGHAVGDSVLQIIANRLTAATRSDDTISRYGGDEFLYLLTEINDDAHVEIFANRLVELIESPCTVSTLDAEITFEVKASIGIAIFPKDGQTLATLIGKADAAMYQAKRDNQAIAFAK